MEKRPNILIITSDQQRKDSLGIYNQNVHTPVLDAIASDGITMDRAYITHPTCTPSRASILTGQMASHHGAYTIGTALNEDTVKFSDLLSKEGYDTFFTGKPHFQQLSDPDSFEWSGNALNEEYWKGYQSGYYGFKDLKIYNGHTDYSFTAGMHYRLWLKEKGLSDEEISSRFNYIPSNTYREHGEWKIERKFHPTVFTADCAVDYLTRHKTENPFLMWVSFSDPHDPHVVPEPYASMYAPEDVNYLGSVIFSAFFGIIIGAISGYYGGWADNLIMRICDIIQSIPGLILNIALACVLGPGVFNTILALGFEGIAGTARLMRSSILNVRKME